MARRGRARVAWASRGVAVAAMLAMVLPAPRTAAAQGAEASHGGQRAEVAVDIASANGTTPTWLRETSIRRATASPGFKAQARVTDPATDWRRVRRLDPGDRALVTAPGRNRSEHQIVAADDVRLIVLDANDLALSLDDRQWLGRLTPGFASEIISALRGNDVRNGETRLAPAGVYRAGRRIGDLTRFFVEIPRADVIEVSQPAEAGSAAGKAVGTALYALGGFGIGLVVAGTQMFKQCGGSCSDEKAIIYGSVIGLPAGLGYLGWRRSGDRPASVIYRRP